MKYGYGGSKNNGSRSDDGESVRVQLLIMRVMQQKNSGSIAVLVVFLRAGHWRGTNFVRVLLQQLMILVNHSLKSMIKLNFSEIQYSIRL